MNMASVVAFCILFAVCFACPALHKKLPQRFDVAKIVGGVAATDIALVS